ncbi:MAG: hypothetical protein O7B81_07935 [Gammaproteobacteria bacterium]|nr:hypothetical protein [Gammaproteobacteria bacterium]
MSLLLAAQDVRRSLTDVTECQPKKMARPHTQVSGIGNTIQMTQMMENGRIDFWAGQSRLWWTKPVLLLLALAAVPPDCTANDPLKRVLRHAAPELQAVRVGRYLFISDHRLDKPAEMGQELESLHRRLQRDLKIAPLNATLRIYIFDKHSTFSRYVRRHIPYLTRADMHRDALFLLRNGKPYVFAVRTDKLMENLRHELVHVYLNTAVPGVPIWLDEGLAMYYQSADGEQARPELIQRLGDPLLGKQRPDLERLERLRTMRQMGPVKYIEAWAWVSALLHGPQEVRRLIPEYLAALQSDPDAATLSGRLRQRGFAAGGGR